jgi:hypothetical protein
MHTQKHMTKTRTLRVSAQSHATIQRFATERGTSLIAAVDRLVEEAERSRFWDGMDAYHAALRDNPQALADYRVESEALEGPIADGLDEWPWEAE